MRYFEPQSLRVGMRTALGSLGVVPEACDHVSEALVEASVRGVDSHGINLFPHYCRVVRTGRINRDPKFSLAAETASTALLDADHGFGHHSAAAGMQIAINKASETGIGAVSIRNSTHFASAAYYGLIAARRGYIGMAFTNADSLVKAHGSAKAYFGTNPICVTAPLVGEEPLCLDMSTSIVSFNRIKNYRVQNKSVDPSWGCTIDGNPTTDPHAVRTLNPIGTYKGFGLGMIVELLCGILAGGPYAHQLIPMFVQLDDRRSISHFVMAIDPGAFINRQVFVDRLQEMVGHVRALPPEDPESIMMVPGDPEKRTAQTRTASGIPIDEERFQEFLEVDPCFEAALVQ